MAPVFLLTTKIFTIPLGSNTLTRKLVPSLLTLNTFPREWFCTNLAACLPESWFFAAIIMVGSMATGLVSRHCTVSNHGKKQSQEDHRFKQQIFPSLSKL